MKYHNHYTVTEYQIFSGTCSCCNKKHIGQLPIGVTFKMFGAKTYALLAILTSKYRLSKMLAKNCLQNFFLYQLALDLYLILKLELAKLFQHRIKKCKIY